ncbi:unnamed protein product, partial [Pylaiella littoralis]
AHGARLCDGAKWMYPTAVDCGWVWRMARVCVLVLQKATERISFCANSFSNSGYCGTGVFQVLRYRWFSSVGVLRGAHAGLTSHSKREVRDRVGKLRSEIKGNRTHGRSSRAMCTCTRAELSDCSSEGSYG